MKTLLINKKVTDRMVRWIIKLQEYPYEMVYRKGAKHVNTDSMTRGLVARELMEDKKEVESIESGIETSAGTVAEEEKRIAGTIYTRT